MKKVEIVKQIDAPPKEVWDYISDIKTAPEWVVVMQALVESTHNPVQMGTVYKERSKVGPKESETTWHVTRFEEQKIQVHECNEKDFKAILTMWIEPNGDSTKLYHTTEYELITGFRPLGWLVENLFVHKSMIKNLNDSVENCKRLIEQLRK